MGRRRRRRRSSRTRTSRSTRRRRCGRGRSRRSPRSSTTSSTSTSAHDFEPPLAYMHARVEGRQEYTQLFFIPQRAPFDLWDREHRRGIKLYVRRVFIMDDAEQLMPPYLRFVRGVDRLERPAAQRLARNPAAVARRARRSAPRRSSACSACSKISPNNQADKFATFWKEFGRVLKEGAAEDAGNRDRIAKLLRFASTQRETDEQTVSLADYVGRMKEGQDAIYYITADGFAAGEEQPAPRDLPQARRRSAADVRPHRRVGRVAAHRVRGQAAAVGRQGRPRPEQARRRGREAGAGASRPTTTRVCVERMQKALERSRQRGPRHAPADRFAGVSGQRRARHEHASRAHAEGRRARTCPTPKPMLEINPQPSDRPAAEGRDRTSSDSPTGATSCSIRRRWPKAVSSRIRRLRQAAQRVDADAGRRGPSRIWTP